jgi:hypothetical protein
MEHQLFRAIVQALRECDKGRRRVECLFQDVEIAAVWFWAVIHDRSVSWAVQRKHWPLWHRGTLPSNSTMSRRLKTKSMRRLLAADRRLFGGSPGGLWTGRRHQGQRL